MNEKQDRHHGQQPTIQKMLDVQLTTCSFKGVQKGENNYWSDSNGTMYPK